MKLLIGRAVYNPTISQAICKLPVIRKQIFTDHVFVALDPKHTNELISWTLTKWQTTKFNNTVYLNKYISPMGYNGKSGPQYLGNPGFKWPKDSFILSKNDELNRYLVDNFYTINQAINENLIMHGDKVDTFIETMKYLGLN